MLLHPHTQPQPRRRVLLHTTRTQNDACYVSCDGGRVCRPLIICDAGVPRVTQEHINKLKTGGCTVVACMLSGSGRAGVRHMRSQEAQGGARFEL